MLAERLGRDEMIPRFSRIFKKVLFFERPQAELSNRRVEVVYTFFLGIQE